MKRFLLVMQTVLLCLLAGCVGTGDGSSSAPASEEGDPITIGFSQVGAESDWRVSNTESIRSTFTEEKGYELIYSDAQQKQENQFTAIRRFILQGVDYILLAPVKETGWDSVLLEAQEAGIPVILVDRMIDTTNDSLYTAFVGSNFYEEGKNATAWLEEHRSDPLNIVHIYGTLDSSAQFGRTKALIEAVDRHEDWTLAAQIAGDFTQAKSYESMKALLEDGTDFNVVYCENDNMALGVIQALEASGIDPASSDITILSFDGTNAGLQACLEGKIDMDVECYPMQGPEIEQVVRQLENGETPDKIHYLETTWFDTANLTQEIVDGRDY